MAKVTKEYKIEGMDCPSCAMVVEGELEDAGVTSKCNYAKQHLSVHYDSDTIQEEQIHDLIKVLGYALQEK